MVVDVLSILEAAYRPAESREAWMREVLAKLAPALDRGLGCVAAFYDFSKKPHETFGEPVATSESAERFARIAGKVEMEPGGAELSAPLFLGGSMFHTASVQSKLGARWPKHAAIAKHHGPLGVRDVLGLVTRDPAHAGFCVLVPMKRVLAPSARETLLWSRIAAHLASGLRLLDSPDKADAIAAPNGRIEHAEGDARGAASIVSLARAVRATERARGKLRKQDPDQAIAIWRGLVDGRWSLVDSFDHDGRRFIVARRNEPRSRAWKSLTSRERQVVAYAALGHGNKMIAYELGLSMSTVAMHLSRAAAKIGVRSRVALIQAYSAETAERGR